ncbi:tyrosine recombinase [Bacteroidia bacterium]|nr:tyrosine recombinase [Bacteroidia bacterium]
MKELVKTKATVRLRKVEDRKEWYLYIESYPVYVPRKNQAQRVREYLNRTVSTVEWDKKRTARTDTDGVKTYKPRRDDNGLIICQSDLDRESVLYADGVRKLRQNEYNNADLYSDTETAQAEQKERSGQDFMEYFAEIPKKRHANSSKSSIVTWGRTYDLLKLFAGDTLPFSKIENRLAEEFKIFLLSASCNGTKSGTIARNTAATYFSIFKAALHQAFVDNYLTIDLSAKVKGIQKQETRRECLTLDELNALAATPCDYSTLKNAALFSALTGLRHCDIHKLLWKEIQMDGEQARLNFTQQKTKGVEYMPISAQTLQFCGTRRNPDQLVFEDLPSPSWISEPLQRWIKEAGITKKITFHCFRHTFATLQLANGTDIYTVSKMLGHTDVKTTQIYAKVVDAKKNKASQAIQLNTL